MYTGVPLLSGALPRAGPRRGSRCAVAALVYLLLSLVYLRPIWRELGRAITPDMGDPLFVLCILKWGGHQLHLGLRDFWNAPFFYPSRQVTTFSDALLGPAVLMAAFTSLWPNPLAGYNLLVLSSFVLSGWATWYVFQRRGLPFLPALLGGAMFAFSPFRWENLNHLAILLAGLIPLVLWSFDRLLERTDRWRAALFLLFYALHLSGGTYLAYMIHVPLVALLASHLLAGEGRGGLQKPALKVLLPTALLCAALVAATFLPYALAFHAQGLSRGEGELRVFGATALSFLTPSTRNLYAGIWPVALSRTENSLFAGLLPTALLALAAVLGWRRARRSRRDSRRTAVLSAPRRLVLGTLLGIAAVGYLLGDAETWTFSSVFVRAGRELPHRGYNTAALLLVAGLAGWALLRRRWTGAWPWRRGEVADLGEMNPWERGLLFSGVACLLLAHPLVYVPLAKVVPGLNGMRVPARFYAFVSLSIAWFAARALVVLFACLPRARDRRLAMGLLTAALVVELAPRAVSWVPLPQERDFPEVYSWLKDQSDIRGLLELPLNNATEARFLYYWTLHWKPLVNGYSGFVPEDYTALKRRCCELTPDAEVMARLRANGVTHVLFHKWALPERWEINTMRRWARQDGVELVYADGDARLFRIAPSGRRIAGIPLSLGGTGKAFE
jgi:hypothetical protein